MLKHENYQAQTPQILALTKIFAKFCENKHTSDTLASHKSYLWFLQNMHCFKASTQRLLFNKTRYLVLIKVQISMS